MKRESIITADGSSSLRLPEWDEQYHSKHGALQEARHVFIKNGLKYSLQLKPEIQEMKILEMGFGTGLNALLTAIYAHQTKQKVHYVGLEAYPLAYEEAQGMNYPSLIKEEIAQKTFEQIHCLPWENPQSIGGYFTLHKKKLFFEEFRGNREFDLLYFDAFGARVQPNLWEKPVLRQMYAALAPGGVFVTYSSKGSVRRTLMELGFEVEKIPGPPGKREMLRAKK